MVHCWKSLGWRLGLVSLLGMGYAIASLGDCARAQITPDGTLGAESSVVAPAAPGATVDVISGGATRGANLFHSFEQFSVLTGREAFFNNAADIQNIISRVTGGSVSNIDGLLRANPSANLFLINPNGIIFGPNASLNIGGSFVATTANAIGFGNQGFFSASAPDAPPLLTVNPDAFFFNQIASGSITNNSTAPAGSYLLRETDRLTGLRVPDGQSLLLVGGDVRLQERAKLHALGGRVELGGLASPGSVGLSMNGSLMNLSFPDGVARANVYLTNRAEVNVANNNGGSIAITARNIDILGGSTLRGGIHEESGFPGAQAGDFELRAQGEINLEGVLTNVGRYVGNSGNINVTAESLVLRGSEEVDTRLATATLRQGGKAGDINITAGSVFVRDAALNSRSDGARGDGGDVNINARDTVSFSTLR